MTTSQPQPQHKPKHESQQPHHYDNGAAEGDSAGAERARRRDDVLWRLAQHRQRSKASRTTVRLPTGMVKARRRKSRSAGRAS